MLEKHSLQFLMDLLAKPSPSGHEKPAATVWKKCAQCIADSVQGDVLGNSIAKLNGKRDGTIMLAGHIDELGLAITFIEEDGFLRFKTIGGWDPQVLVGQGVNIYSWRNNKFRAYGVIGRVPTHLHNADDEANAVDVDALWIDCGLGRATKKFVQIGDYAAIDYDPRIIAKKMVIARGLDDRIGTFIALEAMRFIRKNRISTSNIFSVATVREELAISAGAVASAYTIKPQVGIAIDVTFEVNHPEMNHRPRVNEIKLGKGPVIFIGSTTTPSITALLIDTAKKYHIPFQKEAGIDAAGDADIMQISRGGVAAGLIGIPQRYMHSPREMVHLNDVWNAIRLAAYFCGEYRP